MINGVHAILYSKDADRLREFFHDVLDLPSVDAGRGWLIFALPPAELAVHPTDENTHHELYLMCDDIHATIAALKQKQVDASPIVEQRWGLLTQLSLPNGDTIGLYQPRHPTAINLSPR